MNRRNQFKRRFKISEEERRELFGSIDNNTKPKPEVPEEESDIEMLEFQEKAMNNPAFMTMSEMLLTHTLSDETVEKLLPYRAAKWYFVLQANNLLGEWMDRHPDQGNNIDIGSSINMTRAICGDNEWQEMLFELSENLDDMAGTELMKALPILHENIGDEELCRAKTEEMAMARDILLSTLSGKELEETKALLDLIEMNEVLAMRHIEFWLTHYEYNDIEPIKKALWNLQVTNAGSYLPEEIRKAEEEND